MGWLRRPDGSVRPIPKKVRHVLDVDAKVYADMLKKAGFDFEPAERIHLLYEQMHHNFGTEQMQNCLFLTEVRFVQIVQGKVEAAVRLSQIKEVTLEPAIGKHNWDQVFVATRSEPCVFTVSSGKIGNFFRQILSDEASMESVQESQPERPPSQQEGEKESALIHLLKMENKETGTPYEEMEMPSLKMLACNMTTLAAVHIDMRSGFGGVEPLAVTDRKGFIKKSLRVFSGVDAISWTCKYCLVLGIKNDGEPVNRETVSSFLQAMMVRGLFRGLHSLAKTQVLDNKKSSYRFREDEDESTSPAIILNIDTTNVANIVKSEKRGVCPLDLSSALLISMLNAISPRSLAGGKKAVVDKNKSVVKRSPTYLAVAQQTQELHQLITDDDLLKLSGPKKICFFFNVYNLLAIHSGIEVLNAKHHVLNDGLKRRVSYQIGSTAYSLQDIEYTCLRGDTQVTKNMGEYFGVRRSAAGVDIREQMMCNGWDKMMSLCLTNVTRSCPRVFVFVDSDILNDVFIDIARDFIYRNVKFGFVPDPNKPTVMKSMICYAPKILKGGEFGGGDSRMLLDWLIPFCPISLQLYILQQTETLTTRTVTFVEPDSTFFIDISHIDRDTMAFIDADDRIFKNKANQTRQKSNQVDKKSSSIIYWSLDSELSKELLWLDEITNLEALKDAFAGVAESKAVRHPLGKMVQVFIKSILRDPEAKPTADSVVHPLLDKLINMISNLHLLICRYSSFMANRESVDALRTSGPLTIQAAEDFRTESCSHQFASSSHIVPPPPEEDQQRAKSSVTLSEADLALVAAAEGDDVVVNPNVMTDENVLQVLEKAILGGRAYKYIISWYITQHKEDDEMVAICRKQIGHKVTLKSLQVDDFFRLSEDEMLEDAMEVRNSLTLERNEDENSMDDEDEDPNRSIEAQAPLPKTAVEQTKSLKLSSSSENRVSASVSGAAMMGGGLPSPIKKMSDSFSNKKVHSKIDMSMSISRPYSVTDSSFFAIQKHAEVAGEPIMYHPDQPYLNAVRSINGLDMRAPVPSASIHTLGDIIDQVTATATKYWEQQAAIREAAEKEGDFNTGKQAPKKRRNMSADDVILILTYLVCKADPKQSFLLAFVHYLTDFIEQAQNVLTTKTWAARYYEEIAFGQGAWSLISVQSALRYARKLPETIRFDS